MVLIPNRHWGGEGLLGCVFGFGLLHRIPPQPIDQVPVTTPEELREVYEEQNLIIPADDYPESQVYLEEWQQREKEQWIEENQVKHDPNPLYSEVSVRPHGADVLQKSEIQHNLRSNDSNRSGDEI